MFSPFVGDRSRRTCSPSAPRIPSFGIGGAFRLARPLGLANKKRGPYVILGMRVSSRWKGAREILSRAAAPFPCLLHRRNPDIPLDVLQGDHKHIPSPN